MTDNSNEDTFVSTVEKFIRAKKSLFIWADNTPYTFHADIICKKIFNKMHFNGNYYGGQIIVGSDKLEK